jgi:hypothetical protein
MIIYTDPLTEEETKSCMLSNGKLQATIRIRLSEIITCNGIEGFNNLVDNFFPSLYLSDISCKLIGSDHLPNENNTIAEGFIYIQVNNHTD